MTMKLFYQCIRSQASFWTTQYFISLHASTTTNNQPHQVELFQNPFNFFQVSIWEKAHQKFEKWRLATMHYFA